MRTGVLATSARRNLTNNRVDVVIEGLDGLRDCVRLCKMDVAELATRRDGCGEIRDPSQIKYQAGKAVADNKDGATRRFEDAKGVAQLIVLVRLAVRFHPRLEPFLGRGARP
jgi:hypothetical protein